MLTNETYFRCFFHTHVLIIGVTAEGLPHCNKSLRNTSSFKLSQPFGEKTRQLTQDVSHLMVPVLKSKIGLLFLALHTSDLNVLDVGLLVKPNI